MAGATVVIHSAGWLEGGLTVSYEKLITDVEVLNMVAELCAGKQAGADEIGFDTALCQVAPGGHFFATSQTMERFKTEFYEPIVHDYANHGTWSELGANVDQKTHPLALQRSGKISWPKGPVRRSMM